MTISGGNQHNNNANRKYEKLIKQPQMQFGTSVTGTQTDVNSGGDADASDVGQDFSNFNKHFGNGHAITDRTMLLPLEDDVTNAGGGIVTYKGKSNGNGNGNGNGIGSISLDFNGSPTSSTSIGIASSGSSSSTTHLVGGLGGGSSEPGGWMCHCCNLIARRCFGINVRRCVLALLAITVVSIFYYTHYVDTGVFNG